MSRERADRVAAWATGAGIGFIVFMVTWLIGNRLTALLWDPPAGPVVALGAAVVAGAVGSVIAGRKLSSAQRMTAKPH